MHSGNRFPPLDKETIASRIEGRLERQAAIAARTPPVGLCFVLYEAVLRSPLVDAAQLDRLLAESQLPNVHLQVLPFDRATFPGALMGPMVLLETRDHERFAFTEGQFASELSADPAIVSKVTERLSMIRALALSPAESADFIKGLAKTDE
ncbi:hypothetical protein GCM10009535_41870 [Streptomyces thermocarboxydovorans]|uniref:DUF5753 domain-containing protein n=1 Tax=Streptomyces thermocarboxydovorans TaxID=59298 RepID=A0ABP3SWN8_9ACTN